MLMSSSTKGTFLPAMDWPLHTLRDLQDWQLMMQKAWCPALQGGLGTGLKVRTKATTGTRTGTRNPHNEMLTDTGSDRQRLASLPAGVLLTSGFQFNGMVDLMNLLNQRLLSLHVHINHSSLRHVAAITAELPCLTHDLAQLVLYPGRCCHSSEATVGATLPGQLSPSP